MSGSRPSIRDVLSRIERHQRIRRVFSVIGVLVLLSLTVLGLTFLGLKVADLYRQLPAWFNSLKAFLSPDFVGFSIYSSQNNLHGWSGLIGTLLHPGTIVSSLINQEGIIGASIITIVIGFTGTVLGFPLALTFGVLGSERVTPFPFNFIFRGTMSTIRAIPALVWILIFVPLAGITPVSATLAVATDTIGNMGRLFTDELEEIDDGPIEAIASTGASDSQTVVFGMLSQVFTSFIAWTLYTLEINVRIAISLGVVGAGGIGKYINQQISLLQFGQAAAGILMVIVIVLSVELTSSRLRSWLRPGEEEGTSIFDAIRELMNQEKWFGVDTERP